MGKILVGIMGPKGVGKSPFAAFLGEVCDIDRLHIAAPLKRMLEVLGLTPDQLDGAEKEIPTPLLMGKTPREAMQTLGTEWGRDCIHIDLWVAHWVKAAEASPSPIVVNEGVRYPNEAEAIKARGGLLFRVSRDGFARAGHSSETADLPPADVTIEGASLPQLRTLAHEWGARLNQRLAVGRTALDDLRADLRLALKTGWWGAVEDWVANHRLHLLPALREDLNASGIPTALCQLLNGPQRSQWDRVAPGEFSGGGRYRALLAYELFLLAGGAA